MRVLYNILMSAVITLGIPVIIIILIFSDKRRKTFFKRLAIIGIPEAIRHTATDQHVQKPLWMHALSVGEVLSAVPLAKALKDRMGKRRLYFSVSTKTGFDMAENLLGHCIDGLFYFPYDFYFSVKRLADRVDPDLVIIVETDLWINFMRKMNTRRTPVILVNARLSDKSFSGYKRFLVFLKALFSSFSFVCVQTEKDKKRFQKLGTPEDRIKLTGNVKFDQPETHAFPIEKETLTASLNIMPNRKVFLAGSTHKGEEEILLAALRKIKIKVPDLMIVIAPRDPKRAKAVRRLFASAGFPACCMDDLRTAGPGTSPDVIVIDAIGYLRQLYAISYISFVGGSLVNEGGHNPIEPAVFSKPVIFGQDMRDFFQPADLLLKAGGAIQVKNAETLYQAIETLITDPEKSKAMGQAAYGVFIANQGAVEKTLNIIEGVLKNHG